MYHVLNRANGRLRIFRKEDDFLTFEKILADGAGMFSVRLCGYCIPGNHWHSRRAVDDDKAEGIHRR